MTEIRRIRLGTCNTYLLEGSGGAILVDAGNKGKVGRFIRVLGSAGIEPGRIGLIIITHVHFDHVGSLAEIKRLCRCPVAVHRSERGLLAEGVVVMPPGTNLLGRLVSAVGRKMAPGPFAFEPVTAELEIDESLDLAEFGVQGRVLHTPGHTGGSLSVLLEDGHAVVGDTAVRFPRPGGVSVMPPFAEDTAELLLTWQKLVAAGVRRLYPAHGLPFPVEDLENELRRRLDSC